MNSVNRHICDVKKSPLKPDFPTSLNDSGFVISQGFYFHKTKTLAKISEFTVAFLSVRQMLRLIV